MECLFGTLWYGDTSVIASAQEIDVVGHRVVHGGATCEEPVVINADIKALIASMSCFAPLHIQAEVEGIDTAGSLLDGTPQVAVFDTGFHCQMPLSAAVYPVPYEWFENGIRRYGFHGINHEYCAGRGAQLLHRELNNLRIVSCHLGNGCSLAAIRDGRSVDTTMGFTPLGGRARRRPERALRDRSQRQLAEPGPAMSAKHEQRRVLLLNGLRDRPPHRSHVYFKV